MEFNEEMVRKWEKNHTRGKFAGGLLIVTVGTLFLMRELGAEIPQWIFTWKTLLIGIGLVGLIKHGFSRMGWLIPMAVGGAFLVSDLYPELLIKSILWPVVIIIVGLFIMFRPRRKFRHEHWRRWRQDRHRYADAYRQRQSAGTSEDFIDSTAVMGGVEKNILSKQFKGGDVTNVFGGTELDLSQADFEGKITLEVTQVFGGTKLIVPAHWQIQTSTTVTVLGSIEDKRPVNSQTGSDPNKILVLNGTTIFGGIEIRSI
jgi:predicted membrane protein